jgi:hypothetical protein
MSQYAKALVAFITPLIMSLLLPLGISPETPVIQAVEVILLAIITAVAVFVIPNRP